jgi:hypothetical protein
VYTAATTTALATNRSIEPVLLIKGKYTGNDDTWTQFPYETYTRTVSEDAAATLSISMLNKDLLFSDEGHSGDDIKTYLRALVRLYAYGTAENSYPITGVSGNDITLAGDLTAVFEECSIFEITGSTGNDKKDYIATVVATGGGNTTITVASLPDATVDGTVIVQEHECRFDGWISKVEPRDQYFSIQCVDHQALENECECEIDMEPDRVTIIAEAGGLPITARQVTLISANLGGTYGFPYSVANADAFAENVDVNEIKGVDTGADWFTVTGNKTASFPAGQGFRVSGSTGNDGFWVVESSSFAAGPNLTTINVTGNITNATVDGYIILGAGRRSWATGNIQLWREASVTALVTDDPTQDPPWEDTHGEVPPKHYSIDYLSGAIKLLEPASTPDGARTYYVTGVDCYKESAATAATDMDYARLYETAWQYAKASGGAGLTAGQCSLPDTGIDINTAFYYQGSLGTLMDKVREATQVNLKHYWDSATKKLTLKLVSQAAVADVALLDPVSISQPRDERDLYTRIVVTGQSTLPQNECNSSTVTSVVTGTPAYFAWNANEAAANTSNFDAVKDKLYDGDAAMSTGAMSLAATGDWTAATGKYDGWYSFCQLDMGSTKRVYHIRLHMPGSRNENYPYGDQRVIDGTNDVGFWPGVKVYGSLNGSDWYIMAPGLNGHFKPMDMVEARGDDILRPKARYIRVVCQPYKHGIKGQSDPSIGLGEFEVYADSTYRHIFEIDPNATPATYYEYADGTAWKRNYSNLYTRVGGFKTQYRDLGNDYDEYLARDIGIKMLAESIRLFQSAEYTGTLDPRVNLYDTVSATDDMNGNLSFMVTGIVDTPERTTISGTDYLAAALDAGD